MRAGQPFEHHANPLRRNPHHPGGRANLHRLEIERALAHHAQRRQKRLIDPEHERPTRAQIHRAKQLETTFPGEGETQTRPDPEEAAPVDQKNFTPASLSNRVKRCIGKP